MGAFAANPLHVLSEQCDSVEVACLPDQLVLMRNQSTSILDHLHRMVDDSGWRVLRICDNEGLLLNNR
jgi:hypothetical protein